MKAYIELLENGSLPFYAHPGDAGMDIRAKEDVILRPRETKVVKTGIKIAVPEGYEIDVRPRSGLSLKTPLRVCNAPGTIDSGYRDEIGVIIQNTSLPFHLDENNNIVRNEEEYDLNTSGNLEGTYVIKKGDRIAQLVFMKHEIVDFEKIDNIKTIENDRKSGFGGSGIK